MEFISSHTYDLPLAEVTAAFLDADVHVARYQVMGDRAIEVLHRRDTADTLELTTVRTVQGEVPKLARKFVSSTNTVTTTDTWTRAADGTATGTSLVAASNVPGTATIEATLRRDGEGTAYDIVLTLALDVPLLGDRFVTLMRPKVLEIIDAEFAAWERYFTSVMVWERYFDDAGVI